jgi:hypothetical protein
MTKPVISASRPFFDKSIGAFARLPGLFCDAAMKLRGNAQ